MFVLPPVCYFLKLLFSSAYIIPVLFKTLKSPQKNIYSKISVSQIKTIHD